MVEGRIELTDITMACVICGDSIDLHNSSEYVTLTEKDCVGINKASHDRNLNILDIKFTDHCNIIVHKVCRSRHTNPKSVRNAPKRLTSPPSVSKSLRSGQNVFNFKTHCFFWGDVVDQSLAHKKNIASYKYSHVMTFGFQENIHTHCQGRQDDWATQIQSLISAVSDLPAEEALCHHTCKDLFLKGKDFPGVEGATYTNKKRKVGRPKSSSKVTALHYAYEHLEQNDDET